MTSRSASVYCFAWLPARPRLYSSIARVFVWLIVLLGLGMAAVNSYAVKPAYVKDFTYGGTLTHTVGNQTVARPDVAILITSMSVAAARAGSPVVVVKETRVPRALSIHSKEKHRKKLMRC